MASSGPEYPMSGKRSIIVTGASSGIGAYCARALYRDVWRVFATARRPEDLAALRADGIEAFYLDYAEPDSIRALEREILDLGGGRLDALFNNGAYAQPGAVEDLPVEALREQFEANLFGWHDLTRRLIPVMRRQGHGRIVNCSSILGLVPRRFRGAYCASKHALEGLTLCLRSELRGTGIEVSLIEPGPIESRIATNGLAWFRKYVSCGNSPHRIAYQAQIDRMESGGSRSRLKGKPEHVYRVLDRALTARRPKPHYIVTVPASVGTILKRVLPAELLYRIVATGN